jgi:Terminase small subunit
MNQRQETFALEYIKCGNATAAAKIAGYSEKTAGQIGEKLLKKVETQAFINKHRMAAATRTELTVAGVTARLLVIADKAEAMDGPQALSVARQSLMDAAKLNGLVVETQETLARSPDERAARLAALRAERDKIDRAA